MLEQLLQQLKIQENQIKELSSKENSETFRKNLKTELKEMTIDYISTTEYLNIVLDNIENNEISAEVRKKIKDQFLIDSNTDLALVKEIKEFISNSEVKDVLMEILIITIVSSKSIYKRIPRLYEELIKEFPELENK